MPPTQRKRIGVVIGLLILAGLGWLILPFITTPGQMENFCSSLPAGSSVAQVRAQAAQQGYKVLPPIEGRAFVHESSSFGRFTCDLQFGPDGLVSSVYSFND